MPAQQLYTACRMDRLSARSGVPAMRRIPPSRGGPEYPERRSGSEALGRFRRLSDTSVEDSAAIGHSICIRVPTPGALITLSSPSRRGDQLAYDAEADPMTTP